MGGDHGPPIGSTRFSKVPDYRIYKIEDAPQLQVIQRMLAQQGLKDPWLRNHVWKYYSVPYEYRNDMMATKRWILLVKKIGVGFKYGLAATVVTIIGETIYDKMFPSEDHGHDHH